MKIHEEIFNEAYNCFIQKRYSDVIISIRRSEQCKESPESEFQVAAENLKGFSYLALNEIDEARKSFENALNIDPNSSQACTGLAEIFFMENQDEKAKIMFEYAVQNNPENQLAVNELKKINRILNLPENDNTLTETKKNREIDFKEVVINAGKSFSNGSYSDAIATISSIEGKIETDVFELQELLTEITNMKAAAHLNLNELEEAHICFEKALNLSPESSTACWGLAEIFYRSNMFNEAKTMFEWALKHDENNLAAKEGLVKINKELNIPATGSEGKRTLRLASGKVIELD